jgi:cyclin B
MRSVFSFVVKPLFQERIPPLVEDFLYICDGAYTHRELIRMETNVLKVVDFNLGIPLSYRFLRRYARVRYALLVILLFQNLFKNWINATL